MIVPPPRIGVAVPDEAVHQMHREYIDENLSMAELARRYNRSRRSISELFHRRGLPTRFDRRASAAHLPNGCFAPYTPLTSDQIDNLIAQSTRIVVPPQLKLEWRHWSMDRRGDFITRIRTKLNSPNDRPTTPFSDNVEPFDYTSPRALQIAKELNAGTNSQTARIKINPSSQGVIWNNRLWFWSHKVGYVSGPWTPEHGRPALHQTIWRSHHNRDIPPRHVISFADGNPNNLAPENLTLRTRDQLCRSNQAASLLRKSREQTSLILKLTTNPKNDSSRTLSSLRQA